MKRVKIKPYCHKHGSAASRAFTLIELAVAVAISAILLVAVGGAITVASKSLPSGSDINRRHADASESAQAMANDIRYAIGFSELTPTAITFTVADRDGDGQAEEIRYQCTGTPTNPKPLTRTINGGDAITVLENVRGLTMTYGTYDITEPGPLVISEGPETLLIDESNTTGSSNTQIQANDWNGARFNLQLGDGNQTWRMTRVKIGIERQGNSNGVMKIQLRTVDGSGLPSTQVLDEVTFLESNGSASELSEVVFTNATNLSPSTDYCVVVVYDSGTSIVGYLRVRVTSTNSPKTALVETDTGESGWQAHETCDVVFQVFGHVTGFNSPTTVTKTRLRWVGIAIEPDETSQTHITMQTTVMTQQEVQ